MANDYATIVELKAELQKTDSDDDASLQRVLDAAATHIDRYCNRPDGFVANSTASARYYPGSGGKYQRIDECIAVTAVAVKDAAFDDEDAYETWTLGTIGSTTEADVFPATGSEKWPEYNRTPYTLLVIGANGDYTLFPHDIYGRPTVQVTAKWGYAETVPDDIKTATIMQAARWWKRLQIAMADATGGGELGVLLYRQRLDPDIAAILDDGGYRRLVV